MTTARERLLQASRTWIKDVLGLPDGKVILAQREEKSPRIPLPFYMVNLVSFDLERGVDEWEERLDGTRTDRGNREATLRVTGFGSDAEEGLTVLGLLTHEFPTEASCRTLGPLLDISSIESTTWEPRFVKDFTLSYAVEYDRTGRNSIVVNADQFKVDINEDTTLVVPTAEPEP